MVERVKSSSDPASMFAKRALFEDVLALLVLLTALKRLDVGPTNGASTASALEIGDEMQTREQVSLFLLALHRIEHRVEQIRFSFPTGKGLRDELVHQRKVHAARGTRVHRFAFAFAAAA